MIDTKFLDQLGRFNLIVNKRVTSNYAGEKRSIAEGRGLVFKDHRIYARGDDIRLIDWRVYARTDDLYVKRYEEERSLAVHIIIDASASIGFGKNLTKFDYASMIGVGFAYLALKSNERFQISTFAEESVVFRPKRGMNQLASMVDNINKVKNEGTSKLLESFRKYKKMINSRSLIVLLSDFLIDIEEVKTTLHTLSSANHEVKIIQVLDQQERELQLLGDAKLKDMETGGFLKTFISPRLRMSYEAKMAEHANEMKKTCDKLGIDFFTVTSDTPIFDAFYKILK